VVTEVTEDTEVMEVMVMEVMVIEDIEVQEEDDGGDQIGVIDIDDHRHHHHYHRADLYGGIHFIGFQDPVKQAALISDMEDGVVPLLVMDRMIVGSQTTVLGVDNSVTHFCVCHSFLS